MAAPSRRCAPRAACSPPAAACSSPTRRSTDRFTVRRPDRALDYGFSVLHCLPVSRADTPSAATGTVMRTHTMRAYADQAGFGDVEIVPIEHDFWRFYRLTD